MYGCMDVWMYGCMDVWMYGCMDVCMYVCMCKYIYMCKLYIFSVVFKCLLCDFGVTKMGRWFQDVLSSLLGIPSCLLRFGYPAPQIMAVLGN